MSRLRSYRRWITANTMFAAWRCAPLTPRVASDVMERVLARAGSGLPVLAKIIERNMRAAGVYDRSLFRAYFRNVARHFANGQRIARLQNQPEAVADLAHREVNLDASLDLLRTLARAGRGAVVAPAHCCNYLVALARLRQAVPICIYLRWSSDHRKLRMKREWCRAAGLDVIIERPDQANPTTRAAFCVDALRNGRILVMTPDIAQKPAEGTPVDWLGRRAYLPAGPASLAMLAEVPMIPMFARYRGAVQWLYLESPIEVENLPRAKGGRPEAIRSAMQRWTDGFSAFLRNGPQAWFLWGDSRWTRVLQGDPKYTTGRVTGNAERENPRVRETACSQETP